MENRPTITQCTKCKHPLSEPVPQIIDDLPYCAECAWECAECGKPFIVTSPDDMLCSKCYVIEFNGKVKDTCKSKKSVIHFEIVQQVKGNTITKYTNRSLIKCIEEWKEKGYEELNGYRLDTREAPEGEESYWQADIKVDSFIGEKGNKIFDDLMDCPNCSHCLEYDTSWQDVEAGELLTFTPCKCDNCGFAITDVSVTKTVRYQRIDTGEFLEDGIRQAIEEIDS